MERSYLDLIDTSRERVKILVSYPRKVQVVTQRRKTTFVTLCNFFVTKKIKQSRFAHLSCGQKRLHQCSIDDITQPRSGLRDGD